MTPIAQIPEWYRRGIATGLAQLHGLMGLGGRPIPEDLAALTQIWIEATWNAPARRKLPDIPQDADGVPRAAPEMMAAAFTILCGQCRWWPVPEQWIDALNSVAVPGQLRIAGGDAHVVRETPEQEAARRELMKRKAREVREGMEARP